MRFCYQFISSVAAQVEREEFVRDLPAITIAIDNRWYGAGNNAFNQLAPNSPTSIGTPVCYLYPVSSFKFRTENFRDIISNGLTTFIATSGLPYGLYGVGSNSLRIFGTNASNFAVLTALDVGNFKKVRCSATTVYVLSTNNTLFYRGVDEPNISSFATSLTQIAGRYDDIETTYRGIIALSGTDVYVKGFNLDGQLGVGVLGVSKTDSVTNMTLLTGQWKRIVGNPNSYHVFLLSATDIRNVWYGAGNNSYNQLGQGDIPLASSQYVTEFVELSATWSQISIGREHSIALSGRTAFGAGNNDNGQLGLGYTQTINNWTSINGTWTKLPKFQGVNHSLLISNNRLFGAGYYIALGQCDAGTNITSFIELSADSSWTDAFAVTNTTFALSSDEPAGPIPPAPPTAPTITNLLTGNQTVSIYFTPAASPDTPLTNYEVSLTNGLTWLPLVPPYTSSPITLEGLDNGGVYFISLRGINAAGEGTPSNVLSARPVGPPDPPSLFTATPGDKRVSVTFAERPNGGASITNYEYSVNGGSWIAFSPPQTTSPFNVRNLPDNQNISLRFRAINAFGAGIASESITSNTFITPIEVFLVGGGGGAGGGGGGGGGVIPWFSLTPPSGATYTVRVGAAGFGDDSAGGNSQFGVYIAYGGGGGGGNGTSGGSGGGGNTSPRGNGCGGSTGSGIAPQGYRGGYGKNNGNWPYTGGTGGGYSGAGGCHGATGPNGWALDAPTKLMGPFAVQGTNYVGSAGGYNGVWPERRYGLGGIGAGTATSYHSTSKINAYYYGCGAIGPTAAGFQGIVCIRYPGSTQTYSGGDFIGYNGVDDKTYHIFTSDGVFERIP